MAAGNPLWDIHKAIWTMLGAWAPFVALVPDRNQVQHIRSTEDAVQHADSATPEHTPQVAVVQSGMKFGDRIASNDSALTLVWNVLITTGETRFDSYFDVAWHTFRAFLTWDTYLQDAVSWNSNNVVTNCDLFTASDSRYDKEVSGFNLHRNIPGWASVWVAETDCEFNHTDLINAALA